MSIIRNFRETHKDSCSSQAWLSWPSPSAQELLFPALLDIRIETPTRSPASWIDPIPAVSPSASSSSSGSITAGIAILALRCREIAVNLTLALVSSAVFGVLCGEVLLRAAIGLGVESVRDPRLYAGWCDDDDQWKLRYRWLAETREALGGSGFAFDPTFGWVAPGVPEEGGRAELAMISEPCR